MTTARTRVSHVHSVYDEKPLPPSLFFRRWHCGTDVTSSAGCSPRDVTICVAVTRVPVSNNESRDPMDCDLRNNADLEWPFENDLLRQQTKWCSCIDEGFLSICIFRYTTVRAMDTVMSSSCLHAMCLGRYGFPAENVVETFPRSYSENLSTTIDIVS